MNIGGNGDDVSAGGAGTWDTTTQNWAQGSGLAHCAWTNANNDAAIFAGTLIGVGFITVQILLFLLVSHHFAHK